MATRIYGASDDLIEFDGDIRDEGSGGEDPTLIVCSDGTILLVKYGKLAGAIWEIAVRREGALFDRLEVCHNENADPYSDVAHFKHGLNWAYVCPGAELKKA